jgi:hypothetical protein
MSFNFKEKCELCFKKIREVPNLNKIITNPFLTALIITLIIIMIVLFVFRDVSTDESKTIIGIRIGIYTFLAVSLLLFLNNKKLLHDQTDQKLTEDVKQVIGSNEPASTLVSIDNVPLAPVIINTSSLNKSS